ncbi:MAG TPA: hypothetical protein VF634_02560 [Pyrinomonadaceae bacterium]
MASFTPPNTRSHARAIIACRNTTAPDKLKTPRYQLVGEDS